MTLYLVYRSPGGSSGTDIGGKVRYLRENPPFGGHFRAAEALGGPRAGCLEGSEMAPRGTLGGRAPLSRPEAPTGASRGADRGLPGAFCASRAARYTTLLLLGY